MTTKRNEDNVPDCSTAGKGFARTENSNIASESCGLPPRGYGNTDFGKQDEAKEEAKQEDNSQLDCSTAGKGFARTEDSNIASESCGLPPRGYGNTDFGKQDEAREEAITRR